MTKWYDHPSVKGDPVSDLRDALKGRGVECVLAHTGGGIMCIAVDLNERYSILIGSDCGPSDQLDTVCSWGYDLEEAVTGYVGGASFPTSPAEVVDSIVERIKALQAEYPADREDVA